MKYTFTILLVVLGVSALAQHEFTRINRKEVQRQISDSSASTGYDKLQSRFDAFDTTLTLAEYRLLYYGAIFQPVDPSGTDERKKEINQAMKDKDYKKTSTICDEVLKLNPLSLYSNYYKGLSLFLIDKTKTDYAKYRDRFKGLMGAIFSSGDGLTCNTGFLVLSVADEYTIIYTQFRIEEFKGQSLVDHCDLLNVKPSAEWPRDQVFFDASEILKKEADMLKIN